MKLHNRDIDHEEVLQLRDLRSFQTSGPKQLSLHNDGHGNNSPCNRRNCGSSTVSSTTAPRNCTTCKPKYRSPCQCTATGESLCFSEKRDHRDLHLRHDGDVDDLDTRTVHHVAQRACQEPIQERHQRNLDDRLHSLHCECPSLNRNIQPLSMN